MPYTSVEIAQRLVEKFRLQEYPIAPDKAFWMPRTILPTYEVSALLRTPYVGYLQVSVTGNGYKTAFTVPAGYRYWLHGFSTDKTSGDFSVTSVGIYDLTTGYTYNFPNTSSADGDCEYETNKPIPMDAGDQLRATAGSYVGTGNWQFRWMIEWEYQEIGS